MANIKKINIRGTVHNVGSILDAYPVGSIYMSTASTNPGSLFGGTWSQISQGRFLLGAGTGPGGTYAATGTGGYADASVVAHKHYFGNSNYRYLGVHGNVSGGDMGSQSGSGRHYVYQSTRSDGSYWDTQQYTGNPSAYVTATGRNMPPYYVVYMWRRTA